ncbi:DUF6234 family protein [Streptomyces sp. FIT100]|uniref:DUF6234 family protein n=1 Tax=Streptomyces sp. FIT100 TaxID=2837956 RepID=UPI0021CA0771|nr:DUF6234 family protein [Streptomyces sp. FIT100]UUN28668.1 hypothetical protein KK483_21495 [Streptomyces sp. FIT100]
MPPPLPPRRVPERGPASLWGDAALALFVVFVDAIALAAAALWAFAVGRRDPTGTAGSPPVESEWYVGGVALLVGLSAYAFVRSRHRITAAAQVLVAAVLCLGLLASVAQEARNHPGPAPRPTGHRCVCHSAGGSCHGCAGD